jgi:TolB-like protein/predicted Ser/Thr protein kinase
MEPGDSLLHYTIHSRLGEGGMGVVYRAEDSRLGRTVALKVLRPDLAENQEWERRFQREVRAASAVSHPGIATIFDVHRDGSTVFYTMEFVEGKNLRKLLEAGPLPLALLLRAGLQVSEAMTEAHRRGIVHRDLKPENVVAADSGFFKVLDFGLACFVTDALVGPEARSRLETITRDTTGGGRVIGTVSYMSPEQAQGLPVDARSDLFSIGVLLHELASGVSPFQKKSVLATFHAIVHEAAAPVRSLRSELPQEFEWIVSRCLAKDPGDRYQMAAELAEDLRALGQVSGSGARRVSSIRRFGMAPSSRRWVFVLGSAVVLAVVGGMLAMRRGAAMPGLPATSGRIERTSIPVTADASLARSIAVAAFANNSSDPRDAWLSQGVPQMITTDLAASPDLKVISSQKLNDLLAMSGKKDIGQLDGATVTELAKWAGAGVVISGSIFKMESGYRIDAQASEAGSGQVLVASKAEGKNVFELVGKLTADLRRGLTAPGAPPSAASQVASVSEETYRAFTRGMEDLHRLRYTEGAAAFREALAADPAYVPAQMRLGMALYLGGEQDEGLEWIRRASSQSGALPDREARLLAVVEACLVTKDPKMVDSRVRSFRQGFPRDPEASLWQAQALSDLSGDHLGAIRVLQEILGEEQDNLAALSILSAQVAEIGSPGDAAAILSDYLARHPGDAGAVGRRIAIYRKGAVVPIPPAPPGPPGP